MSRAGCRGVETRMVQSRPVPRLDASLWVGLALSALLALACGGGSATGPTDAADRQSLTELPSGLHASRPAIVTLPPGYRQEVVLDGLDQPTSLAATPDGRLLIAEQNTGRVRVVRDGMLQDEPWLALAVYFADTPYLGIQELGLVSIAVDPRFEENRFVYIYFTEQDEDGERRTVFARLRDVNGRGAELTRLVTIELAPESTHVAGGIAFDGDAILLGIGDHERGDLPGRLGSPVGKILRIDRDGEALPDNPFVGQGGADPRVYAYGVRNPHSLAVDLASGRAFFADNRDIAGDAVYELVAGADYGWPEEKIALREPLVIYDEPQGLSGLMVYQGDVLSAFTGDLLFCTFHRPAVHWSEPGELEGLQFYERDRIVALGCATGVAEGADGFVYFLSYEDGKLLRISR